MSSSPITLSGFNNIDFGSIVTALMTQARQPETAMQTQQSNLKGQSANVSTLATKLSALDSAATALGTIGSLEGQAVTTSDDSALTFSPGSTTPQGTYEITVSKLAHAQVTQSTTTASDSSTSSVTSGGTLTIGGVDVTLTNGMTLQDVADAINGTNNIGVTASVAQSGVNQYSLVLTGNSTGSTSGFTVSSGSSGIAFSSTNATDASDAQVTVNGVSVISATNTFTNVVPGATFNVLRADPSTSIAVTVSQSASAGEDLIKNFVTAYNDLVSFAQDQATAANNNDGTSIGHDQVLRTISTALQQVLGDVNSADSTYQTLASIGIGFTQTGTLQFDSGTFEDAVNTGGVSHVQALFSGNGSTEGVFQLVHDSISDYTSADGAISAAEQSYTTQIQSVTDQISQFEARLQVQQTALQQEFTAADTAIAALNSQASSLGSLGSSLSLVQ